MLAIAFGSGCGSDSRTTEPGGGSEGGAGFTSEYRRGGYLGINGCIREGDDYASVYEYEVWCDWWSPRAADVDSAVFFLSFRITVWPSPVDGCSVKPGVTALIGRRFGDHWRAYSAVGYYMYHPGFDTYSCGEFMPEPVHARIVYKSGGDSTFTAVPTPR
ncbi:MAG: hypothetical protein PVJ42_07210 [bacterium]|jgi:hypothetical protein